ncbi:MAG: hypothetical protein ACW99G_01640 [Candidatus Thorarchaeota archaeon]|jgi:hypothetical protein
MDISILEKRAIVIVAHNRPRYLRLTLEGLLDCEGIHNWPVYVYLDGPPEERPSDFNSWLPNMPMTVVFRDKNYGILHNTLYSIDEVFRSDSYDAVMWLEDDMLLRPDTLVTFDKYKLPSLVSLREKGWSMVRYTPPPNLIGRETFNRLFSWVLAKKYVGLWDAVRKRPIPEDESSHDCVVGTWVHDDNIVVCREPKSYCLHFGVRGKNQGKEPTAEARRLERMIFAGGPHNWTHNLLQVFQDLDGSDAIHDVIYPKDFVYEDRSSE